MKGKIFKIDANGLVEKTQNFIIPLAQSNYVRKLKYRIKRSDIPEPIKYDRFLLELGEYKYWVHINGVIIKINTSSPAYEKMFKNNGELYQSIMESNVVFVNNHKIVDNRNEIPVSAFSLFDYLDGLNDLDIASWNKKRKILHLIAKV